MNASFRRDDCRCRHGRRARSHLDVRALPEGKAVKIYYCVVEAELKVMMAGKRAGANDFLLKPFDREILTKTFGARRSPPDFKALIDLQKAALDVFAFFRLRFAGSAA